MANLKLIKIDITPKKKVVHGIISYIPTICFLLMFGFFIYSVIGIVAKDIQQVIFGAIVIIISFLIMVLLSVIYDWFESGELIYHKDKRMLEYIEYGVIHILNNKSIYKLKGVTKIKRAKNKVVIFGSVDAIEPMHKSKLKKVIIYSYDKTKEVYELVKDFKDRG